MQWRLLPLQPLGEAGVNPSGRELEAERTPEDRQSVGQRDYRRGREEANGKYSRRARMRRLLRLRGLFGGKMVWAEELDLEGYRVHWNLFHGHERS